MLLVYTMWYVWYIWPLLCYKHAYYERWAIEIIFHAPCHRRGTDDDVRGWDDEWRIERDRLSVLCVNPSHPNIINDNRATHIHLCVRTHTHKHNSNIADKQRKKKWDRKKWADSQSTWKEVGKCDLFPVSLCSRQPRWTIERNNAGKTWLSICIIYIELDWWEFILTFMFCMWALKGSKYTNKHLNIWLKLHCLF